LLNSIYLLKFFKEPKSIQNIKSLLAIGKGLIFEESKVFINLNI